MSPMPLIDPRVEEILRDVARDPRSSLLRVERPHVARELRETRPRVSLGATGLRTAERELLRAHRAEVAWLLKEMCKERLANEDRSKLFLSRYIDAEHEVEILPADELRRRAAELPRADLPPIETPWEDLGIRDLLERATAGPAEARPSIRQLALASLRLEPGDSARICLGLDLTFSGQLLAALVVNRRVSDSEASPVLASMALANAAFTNYLMGNHRASLALHERAVLAGGPRAPSLWRWFLMAIRQGDDVATGKAAKLIREEVQRSATWLREEVKSLRARLDNREPDLGRDALESARQHLSMGWAVIEGVFNDVQ